MTKADLLKAAKGKPSRFDGPDGFSCLLRPLTWGERKELFEWFAANKANANAGMELQAKFITLAVCDEQGAPLLTANDLPALGLEIADAIAEEVARRNGLGAKAGKA